MKYYAIIVDEETGAVNVGDGTDSAYYESIGMTLMDVEQSDVDNQWYLANKCPHLSENEVLKRTSQEEIETLKKQLADTDWVVTKIQEIALTNPEDIDSLVSKYADVIAERQAARQRINELEAEIASL